MADENVRDEARNESPQQPPDSEPVTVSRRQFLLGAGAGVVVGATAGAGAMFLNRPQAPPAPAAPAAPAQAPAQAPAAAPQAPAPAPAPASVMAPELPPTHRRVTLDIDGRAHQLIVDVRESLWEVMTYKLGMSASNVGCDRAQCGACAVVVDGRAVNSCTVLAARLGRGQKILTVNSLSKTANLEDLHPIAKAFHEEGGFQCGICTRGFIMSTYALLTNNPTPNEAELREALSGNICRCAEYPKIYNSVFRAAEEMRKKA